LNLEEDMIKRPTGLELIQAEMKRQIPDTIASFYEARAVATRIASDARETTSLLLLGMGASHYANRMLEPEYRKLGLEAQANVVSEVLYAPLPDVPRTTLLVSQSGGSGEILRYLDHRCRLERRYGLTLEPASPLGRNLPCLIGSGGVEKGFAATRSLIVTLALHAAILEALGAPQDGWLEALQRPRGYNLEPLLAQFANSEFVIFSARESLLGVAEVSALHLAELCRLPGLAFEGGQFRHGRLELLGAKSGVMLLKSGGATAPLTDALALDCLKAGVTPVILDTSGEPALPETLHVDLGESRGLESVIGALLFMQQFLLAFAATRVAHVGEPLRSSKVTLE
jgi:fructoselysine-6-P-deglycase FrlB-like protein